MNQNLYRVIFNRARGIWMAVQETAKGHGKTRRAAAPGWLERLLNLARAHSFEMLPMRGIAFATLCVFGMQAVWVQAQVVAAPGAMPANRPFVDVTANGRPIVEITKPNAAGVSNNQYTEYNVGNQGLILNNSRNPVLTQQGGYVGGNPYLVNGGARVIVNQVVGGNPSQLLGYTEVAGAAAQVVIANPNGIVCNGCGFINTPRGVLTTGTPMFGGSGSLDAFHVTGGSIQIGAAGLNGSNLDQVDLIARSVQINGQVWAKQQLNVVTGSNQVNFTDVSAQAVAPDASRPAMAIDVAQLGGMYANKIALVGTESGVGVNSLGTIAALAGDFTLSNQGQVRLAGHTSANGNVQLNTGGNLSNSGTLYAAQNVSVTTPAQLINSGVLAAQGNTNLNAASINSNGALAAGIDANGNATAPGNLSVTAAGAVAATGQNIAGGNLALNGSSLNLTGAQSHGANVSLSASGAGGDTGNLDHTGAMLHASGSLSLNASGAFLNNGGQMDAAQVTLNAASLANQFGSISQIGSGTTQLTVAGSLDNSHGSIVSNAQNETIHSGSLRNQSGQLSQVGTGTLTINTGVLENQGGTLVSNGQAAVSASSIGNTAGVIGAGQTLGLTVGGDIGNAQGTIQAGGAAKVSAANLSNTGGRIASLNADGLTLTINGQLGNTAGTTSQGMVGGVIGGNGSVTLHANTLSNSGSINAVQNLDTTLSGSLNNSNGTLSAGQKLSLSVNGDVDNTQGAIQSGAAANVSAANLRNAGGHLVSLNQDGLSVIVDAQLSNTAGGVIGGNGTAELKAGTLSNSGSISAVQDLHLTFSAIADNSNGSLSAGRKLDLKSLQDMRNTQGTIEAGGALSVSAANISNTGGRIVSANTDGLTLTTLGQLSNIAGTTAQGLAGGVIGGNGDTQLNAATLNNSGSISAAQNLRATLTTGTLENSKGSLSAGQKLDLTSQQDIRNTQGTMEAGGAATLSAVNISNTGGRIVSLNGDGLTLTATGQLGNAAGTTALGTAGGVIGGNGATLLKAGTLTNSGSISAAKQLTATVTSGLNNANGTLSAGQVLGLTVHGDIGNAQGAILAGGAATILAGSVSNASGRIASLNTDGLSLTVDGQLSNGVGGVIGGNGATTLKAATLSNAGSISAVQNLNATLGDTLTNSGNLYAGLQLKLATVNDISNQQGAIQAGGAISLSGADISNAGGHIVSLGTDGLTLNADKLLSNTAAGVIGGNGDTQLNAATLNNSGSISAAQNLTATLTTGALDNSQGSLGAGRKLQITTKQDISNTQGTIEAGGAANLSAVNISNAGGRITSDNTDGLTLTASGRLSNAAGTTAQGTAGGVIGSNGDATVHAATLSNAGSITAGKILNTVVAGQLDNTQGALQAGGAATVSATGINNASGRIVSLNSDGLTLTAHDLISNAAGVTAQGQAGGIIGSNGTATINAATLTNSGSVTAVQDLTANLTDAIVNSNGSLSSGQALKLSTGNGITNLQGTIQAAGAATLKAANLSNDGGHIMSLNGDGLTLTVNNRISNTTGGVIGTNGSAQITAAVLNNSGGAITAAQNMTAKLDDALNNSSGNLGAGQTLGLTTGNGITNNQGTIQSGSGAKLNAANIANTGGRIIALGTDGLNLNARSQLSNQAGTTAQGTAGGVIGSNGDTVIQTGALINFGSIVAKHNLSATVAGSIDNNSGTLNAGNLVGIAAGYLQNTQGNISGNSVNLSIPLLNNTSGQIVANQVSLTAADLNNEGGQITHLSNAAMTLAVSNLIDNSIGGVIQTNSQDLSLMPASLNNNGGTIAHAGTGTLTIAPGGGATFLANAGGKISSNGNVQMTATGMDNSGGIMFGQSGLGMTSYGNVNNGGGKIASAQDLSMTANALVGSGSVIAARDLGMHFQGDYTLGAGNTVSANRNLDFSVTGNLNNTGTFQAANDLHLSAATITNSNTLAAGGLLTTNSATLNNTGSIVGGSMTLSASQWIANLGTSAFIGASNSNGALELFAPDIENRDDSSATDTQAKTTIYGLGRVTLAGGRDGSGNLTRAGLVRNQSGLIQSGGAMEVAANTLTNTRRTLVASNDYTAAVDPGVLARAGISLSGTVGTWNTQTPSNIGGAYPEPSHEGRSNSVYISTIYTGTATANTILAISPQAQIIAGGDFHPMVTTLQNYWSQVTAGGNIAMNGVTLDQNSWRGNTPLQAKVIYTGRYHYQNYKLWFWDWTFCQSGCTAPADIRTYALPSYESTFKAGGTISGTGNTIHNTAGNAGLMPLPAGATITGTNQPTAVSSIAGVGAVSVNGQQLNRQTDLSGNLSANAQATVGAAIAGSANLAGHAVGPVVGQAGAAVSTTTGIAGPALRLPDGTGHLNNAASLALSHATAVSVLSNISMPQGGLFSSSPPGAPYLIETNPAFTNYNKWLSSDYYFQQMGVTPSLIQKRLGDGFYEQQLVQNQVMSLTGRSVLGGYANNQDEFRALMTSGAALAKSLNIEPGVGLSAAQVAQLTSNVVLMQQQVVNGQTVYVPVVYLAQASQDNQQGMGPVISANNIWLDKTQGFTNSGTVSATNILGIAGQGINNQFGTLQSGGAMLLNTTGDIDLTSASVKAGSLQLQTGGNLILDTAANTLNQTAAFGATRSSTVLGPAASLSVTGDAYLQTGGNFEQHAGSLAVGGDLTTRIGGNWDIGTQQTQESKHTLNVGGASSTHFVEDVGSSIKVGGVSDLRVSGDLIARGAQIDLGGGGSMIAGGNLELLAAKSTSTVDASSSSSSRGRSSSESRHLVDDTITATTLQSGNSLSLISGKDITLTGSTLSLSQGQATLAAIGSVNIGSETEQHINNSAESHSHSVMVSSSQGASESRRNTQLADGSTVSADSVLVQSGKDINITGSAIAATNDVTLRAANNVTINDATSTDEQSSYSHSSSHGLMGNGGLSFSIGSQEQTQRADQSTVTQSQNRSMVGSAAGNLTISAGKDVQVGGSDLVAGKALGDVTGASGNIAVRAQNITIDPGQDTAQAHDQQEAHASGVSLTVTGTPLDTARNLRSASKSGNGFQRTQGVSNELAASALDTPSISLSYGRSSQSSSSELSSTTHTGSALRAGGNLSLTATGGAQTDATGHPLDGDIAISGSTLTAGGTVTADANRNVTFQTSTDQYQQSQQSNSSSMSLSAAGASLGDLSRWVNGGPNSGGVSSSPYNAGRSNSDGNSAATQQTATVVTGNSVVVKSHLGDINVIGSGISGTQGVDLVASQGAINVLAGTDSNAHHQDSSSHQLGSLGSNGTGTGFSVGVSNSHSTQDDAAQTQSGIRSQIASQKGDVTLDAKQDVTLHGADVTAGQDVTLIGKNLNLDPGQDATQSSMSQSASQYGVTLALGGVAGNAVATINQSMNQANHANDPRLAALDKAQAALSAYGLSQALSAGQTGSPALIKATVSVGGGSSQSQSLSNTLATDGSTLKAGGTVNLVATGSGAKDANGLATDGDINARGTQISGQNVSLNAARDINLQSAQDTTHESSSNHSSNGSIGIGAGLGGTQNGFTLELGAGGARGTANGDSTTHRNTQIVASDTVALTSGRDTNLRGAEVTGNTVDASVGRDLTIQSPQDTNTYKSNQDSVGFQASICVPPFCYGQTVSASGNAGTQNIKNNFQSVGQQSGIFAGGGGYKVDVGNHTQLDGGVIASTATADKNTLSTQTLGFSNLQNKADYSGSSLGFSGSIALGQSTTDGVNFAPPATQGGNNKPGASNSAGQGPTGFGVAGVSGSASGTTYAAISPGTITVRGDATGQDSTAGLSRDTTHANGAVQNTFDATKVQKDMAIQQMAGQVGMQVAGDVADGMETQAKAKLNSAMQAKKNADSAGDTVGSAQAQADINAATEQVGLWAPDGAGRTGAHAIIAGVGAVMGGGNVAGAIGGTIAGDVAGNAASHALNPGDEKTLGGTLLSNVVSGAAGAVVGGALGGTNGAMSGANGAFSADMFNRQLHDNEKDAIKHLANGNSSEEHKLEAAGCALVHCAAEYLPGSDEYAHYSALETEGAKYTTEQAELKNYNQTYFTAADYGGMVKQVTQSGLFGYSRDDSEADNQSKAAATQIKRVEAVFGLDPSTAKSIAADMGLLGLVAGTIGGKGNVSEEIIAARDVAAGERGIAGANGGTSAQGTANAASYAGLKLDLQTTQAANEVVESLQTTGKLPPNYVDKTQAAQQGWQPGKALNNSVPGGQLGGDVFNNIPPVNGLPQAANRTWQEVDIGLSNTMSRSNQPGTRLLYSNDGLLYITTDHYKTATPIGTWKK